MAGSLAEFVEKFKDESDRGAALVGVALLDEDLHSLLASFLIENRKEVDLLLGTDELWDRPLSAFSARIRAAYCLGLISNDEFHDLQVIRRIRNDFAHELDTTSFGNQAVKSRCNSLRIFQRLPKHHHKDSSRDKFLFVVGTLSISLQSRTRRAVHERRQVPEESEAIKWER